MKFGFSLCVFLIINFWLSILYSQNWQQLLGDRYGIIEKEGDIVTIRDRYSSATWIKNIGDIDRYLPQRADIQADTTIVIDVATLDTTQFANRFYLMGTVPVTAFYSTILVFDSNQNGYDEIIGEYKTTSMNYRSNRFYEYDPQSGNFINMIDFGVPFEQKGGGLK